MAGKTAMDMNMMGEDMMEEEDPSADIDFDTEAKKVGN